MIGRQLGQYEIVGRLGQGGMGEVFRARDARLGREVALKILPPEMAADPTRLERFRREARTVAGLSHPNIVTLHSVEEVDGIHFLTMERVPGEPLDRQIGPDGLPVERVLEIGATVADALGAAHAQGIVHRDVKASNVMVTPDGHVKVLDFGLAKPAEVAPLDDDATRALDLTAEGSTLGTVPYMSPEQLRGQEVDARSDVFSLGVLLYEMATGKRPFTGPTRADVTSSILRESPPFLTEQRPALPRDLGRIVSRCLEKSPADRYPSVLDLRDDLRALQRAIDGGSTVTGAESPGAGAVTSRPRRPGAPLAAGALLVLAAATVFLLPRITGDRSGPADSGVRTIAVLPFENQSPDEENAFFATGVHEDVMNRLAGLPDVRVISRTSVRRLADHAGDLPAIGRRLGADYVVEGSVRRADGQVRVTAQLVDVETDGMLWTGTFDRDLHNLFAVQSAIAQEIASAMRMTINPEDLDRLDTAPTVVLAAYDNFLRARNTLTSSRWTYEDLVRAVGYLKEAVREDPDFLEGWALLTEALSDQVDNLRSFDGRETEAAAVTREAEAALARARELGPERGETLRAEGYFLWTVRDDLVGALRSLDRALAALPSDVTTMLHQSWIYTELGQVERAVEATERAYALDNANGFLIYGLTFFYEVMGRYADLANLMDRLARLEPEKTHYIVQATYYRFLAEGSLAAFREFEEAVRTIDRTGPCDVRTVQNREMVVAMVNAEFDEYAAAWTGKWDRHHAGHGNWSCPAIINDEANHAALLMRFGDPALAESILETARTSTTRPYTEMSVCIFDKAAFQPKLDFLGGDPEAARREFDEALPRILQNHAFPRGAVEKAVVLETADMVAPDRVYSLYRDIADDPVSMVSLATICANPWVYPNLLRDPRFREEIRRDGRFVEFLETYGLIPGT